MEDVGEALAALVADQPWVAFVAGRAPDLGPGWLGVADLIAGPAVDPCVARLLDGRARGARDVAATHLAGWLAGVLALPAVATWRRAGTVWALDPAGLAVRPHAGGWFDGLAVAPGPLVARDASGLARDLVALLDPLFAAIRARLPYGTAGMWGQVADLLAAPPPDDGDGLVEALAARATRLRARPRWQPVAWAGGVHPALVRGTCCLAHKVGDEGYCTSCPHRSDASRAARTRDLLGGGA